MRGAYLLISLREEGSVLAISVKISRRATRARSTEVITSAPATSAGSTAGASAPAATARSVTALTSSFPLQSGYSVELQTLPATTSASDVTKAEHAAASKGASHTGLILLRDFHVTPAPPAGDYVIYSGAYKAKAAADQALAKLRKQFPVAKVIQVQAAGAGAAPSGKVLAKTQYGSAHQVAGFTPSQSQLSAGAKVVQKIQNTAGKSYVNSQRGLPDQISVP